MKDDLGKMMDSVGQMDDSIFGKSPPAEELEERDFELLDVPSHIDSDLSDAAYDYTHSRQVLYSLIHKAGTNLEMTTQLAKNNQDSRGFQVANEIMNTIQNMLKLLNSNHKLHREVNAMSDLDKNTNNAKKSSNVKFKGSMSSLKDALENGELKDEFKDTKE